jgi:hypothetical protein
MTRSSRQLTAVDLDNALTALTPEVAAHIAAGTPVAWADQMQAAQRDSVALIEAVENTTARQAATTDVEEWLRLGLLDTLVSWTAGKGKTCRHSPNPRLCQHCPALPRCESWMDSLPRRKRPLGVVAGRLNA